jgi:hypothetical protein
LPIKLKPLRQRLLPMLLAGSITAAWGAANATGGPTWQSLTPSQRQVLAPLAQDWPQLSANRKAKWLEIAARYPAMPVEGQQRVQERMTEWARLSPEERGQARSNFQETRRLSHEERRDQLEAYQALPQESKAALAARAARPGASSANTPPPGPGLQGAPLNAQAPKSNIVAPAGRPTAAPKAVAPAMVQAGPGATTSLVATPARPPSHLQTGKPKIDAGPTVVDRSTLLPKAPRVASAGSVVPAAASAPVVSR